MEECVRVQKVINGYIITRGDEIYVARDTYQLRDVIVEIFEVPPIKLPTVEEVIGHVHNKTGEKVYNAR